MKIKTKRLRASAGKAGKRYEMKKTYYKDFYGGTASISEYPNGKARLTVQGNWGGFSKRYDSTRGARIALGKWSDSWVKVNCEG